MPVSIRSERSSDEQSIATITERAFRDVPYSQQTEPYIIRELRQAGALSVSLVAERDGDIIGHVAASPVTIEGAEGDWFGIGPISVDPDHQRQGIGSQLMRRALQVLAERGAAGCVLVGNPDFYQRFGFRAGSTLLLPDVPPQYFLVLAFSGPEPVGEAVFHAAFQARG